jgi:hypothetical protein
MAQLSDSDLTRRLAFDNPWWATARVPDRFRAWPRRIYFDGFWKLFAESSVRRAVVLMGPRRVGKTVLLTQAVQRLIDEKVEPTRILYASMDTPTYMGTSLEKLLQLFLDRHGHDRFSQVFVIFDEVQYLADWEVHLKSLVDSYPDMRFAVSGSAASALKMQGRESGAGRFTDYHLPALGFAEYLRFSGAEPRLADAETGAVGDIAALNAAFAGYIAHGGFPEPVLEPEARVDIDRYLASDIIERVMLRDLPVLYGVGDVGELKQLMTWIAYNTGQEVSYEGLAASAGVAKNTLRKYLEFLEAAYLILRLQRVDQSARRFRRATHFKLYLANPSLRTAFFGPIKDDDPAMGRLAETAFFAQLAQTRYFSDAYYARWDGGEVDCVLLERGSQRPWEALEIKWSDRPAAKPRESLAGLVDFCRRNRLDRAVAATKSAAGRLSLDDVEIDLVPLSLWCYRLGRNLVLEGIEARHPRMGFADPAAPPFAGLLPPAWSTIAANALRVV